MTTPQVGQGKECFCTSLWPIWVRVMIFDSHEMQTTGLRTVIQIQLSQRTGPSGYCGPISTGRSACGRPNSRGSAWKRATRKADGPQGRNEKRACRPSIDRQRRLQWPKGAKMPAVHSTLLERITIDPDVRFGKPCIRGHRITVQELLEWLSKRGIPGADSGRLPPTRAKALRYL